MVNTSVKDDDGGTEANASISGQILTIVNLLFF
jgi:hypothetical protein